MVIGRVNESTKDAMRRLSKVIVTAGGTLLGVIATGAKRSGLYGYGYGAYGGYAVGDAPITGVAASPNGSPGAEEPARTGLLRGRLPGRS